MEEHNNLSNRCPELQNILDSSFGFCVKWGTLLVIPFILLILALSFFVNTREQQTLHAECKACQKHEHLWTSVFYIEEQNDNTSIKEGQDVYIYDTANNLICMGNIQCINNDLYYIVISDKTVNHIELVSNENYSLLFEKTHSLGYIILSAIRKLI